MFGVIFGYLELRIKTFTCLNLHIFHWNLIPLLCHIIKISINNTFLVLCEDFHIVSVLYFTHKRCGVSIISDVRDMTYA